MNRVLLIFVVLFILLVAGCSDATIGNNNNIPPSDISSEKSDATKSHKINREVSESDEIERTPKLGIDAPASEMVKP